MPGVGPHAAKAVGDTGLASAAGVVKDGRICAERAPAADERGACRADRVRRGDTECVALPYSLDVKFERIIVF